MLFSLCGYGCGKKQVLKDQWPLLCINAFGVGTGTTEFYAYI
jgi:hypothetical protein